jgi:hypothetical protein
MELAARLDEIGKPAWIGLMVLGFCVFWPVGLAILAFLIWSGRMGCWSRGGRGRWHHQHGEGESLAEHFREHWRRHQRRRGFPPSGNRAFDDYREGILERLESEQQEFREFLDRLRHAKDKAEFDEFMASRRTPPAPPEGTPPAERPD